MSTKFASVNATSATSGKGILRQPREGGSFQKDSATPVLSIRKRQEALKAQANGN